MTIKELASFTGKTEKTVQRWVAKNNSKMTLSNDKITLVKGQETNLTINQVEAVLRAGSMSKDAVTILMNNAREKTTVIPMNNVDYEIIGKMIGMAVAAAMTPVVKQLENISKPQVQLSAPKEDYFSLLAYCSLHSIKTNRSELAMHGRELRKMALAKDLELKKIPDERWGTVNSYPTEVLEEYFTV